jgi:hypothetical protein
MFWGEDALKDLAAGALGLVVGSAVGAVFTPVVGTAVGGFVTGAAEAGLNGKSWGEIGLQCATGAALSGAAAKIGAIVTNAVRGSGKHYA